MNCAQSHDRLESTCLPRLSFSLLGGLFLIHLVAVTAYAIRLPVDSVSAEIVVPMVRGFGMIGMCIPFLMMAVATRLARLNWFCIAILAADFALLTIQLNRVLAF